MYSYAVEMNNEYEQQILNFWMPKQLSDEEIESLKDEEIEEAFK
jgi:uncharacterized protein YqeY